MDSRKKIIIVDDHQLVSAGIRSLVRHLQDEIEIIECSNAREALVRLTQRRGTPEHFDLMLIDINMPSFTGMDLLTAIKSRKVSTPIAMISGTSDTQTIQNCIDAGAIGFIPKSASSNLIMIGLGKMLNGQRFMPPHLENYIFFDRSAESSDNKNSAPFVKTPESILLKKREKEVLNLMKDGKSNKEIADILDLSQSTVKFHIGNLFRKFSARSRTECVSLAVQNNLLKF